MFVYVFLLRKEVYETVKKDDEIYVLTEDEIRLINERAAAIFEEEKRKEERKQKEAEYLGVMETYLALFEGWDSVWKREAIYSCWIQKIAKYTKGNIFWIADIQCLHRERATNLKIEKIDLPMLGHLRLWSDSILYRAPARSYLMITDRYSSLQEAKRYIRKYVREHDLLPKYERLKWVQVYDFMGGSILNKDLALY